MNVFVLLHSDNGALPRIALETLSAARQLDGNITVGILGTGAQAAADSIADAAARFLVVDNPALAQPRYCTDAAAAAALISAADAEIILAPATARFNRALPGAAARTNAQIDTKIVGVVAEGGVVQAQRWYYRQRIFTTISRTGKPWILLMEGGVYPAIEAAPGGATTETVACEFADTRTTVTGIQKPAADAQTIRPEAKLLFVAGAGWTKKQKDGAPHVDVAGTLIQDFLRKSGASLGSSKSIVDLQSEGQGTLGFMTHMNQVGQTGSTPRHPKGLATCCHGEEPHAVGWRFINERRAINLDANCGWAQGKADVLYVADAFEVMEKLNALIG